MWPFKQQDQEEISKDEFIQYQNRVMQGLNYAIAQLTSRDEQMNAVITAVMLDNGKTECLIKNNFLSTFNESDVVLNFNINQEGNLVISIVKKPDEPEICENCGGMCERGECL